MDSGSDCETETQQSCKRLRKKTNCIEDSESEQEQSEEEEEGERSGDGCENSGDSGESEEETAESEDGSDEEDEGSSAADEDDDEEGEDEEEEDGSYVGSDEEGTASEWESNWESEEEEAVGRTNSGKCQPAVQTSAACATPVDGGFSSDDSDGESERCPICLLRFTDQEVGTPESCDHNFCLDCILEWSKNVNTCPVDRQMFLLILVKQKLNGKVVRNVSVNMRQAQEEVADEDPTYCEVCGESNREDRLLLCDGCDLGYHLECLDPPLDAVPVEEWYCSDCISVNRSGAAQTGMEDDELRLLVEDAPCLNLPSLRPHGSVTRMVARTRQTERIRAMITHNRRTLRSVGVLQTEAPAQPSTSGIESQGESSNSTRQRRPPVAVKTTRKRKRKVTRKRKGTKRRKMSKRKTAKRKTARKKTATASATGKTKTGATKKRATGKRKHRRRVRRKKRKIRTRKTMTVGLPKSVKARLAEQLNMRPPKLGHSFPEMKKSKAHSAEPQSQRYSAGLPVLHIFGQRDDLDYVSSGSEDGGTEVAVAHPRSSSVPMSRQLARRKLLAAAAVRREGPAALLSSQRQVPVPSAQEEKSSVFDILGGILDCQSVLLSKSGDVTLKQDGSIVKNSKDSVTNKSERSDSVGMSRMSSDLVVQRERNIGERHSSISHLPQLSDRSPNPLTQAVSGAVRNRPLSPEQGSEPSSRGSLSASGSVGQSSGNTEYSADRNTSASWSNSDPRGSRAYASFLSGVSGSPNRDGVWEGRELSGLDLVKNNEKDAVKKKNKDKKEEEDDDIDIYSDIEPGTDSFDFENCGDPVVNLPVNSDGVDRCGMELEHASGNDADSDNELVIDDSVVPQEHNLPESEIYDPAEPSQDGEHDMYDPADPSHDSDDQEMVIDESDLPDTGEADEAEVDTVSSTCGEDQTVELSTDTREETHSSVGMVDVTDDSSRQETEEVSENFIDETPDTQVEDMSSECLAVVPDDSAVLLPSTTAEEETQPQLHSLVGDYDSPSSDGIEEEEEKAPAGPKSDTVPTEAEEVECPQEISLPEEQDSEPVAEQEAAKSSPAAGEHSLKSTTVHGTELHLLRPGHLPVLGIHSLRPRHSLGLAQAGYSPLYSPDELETDTATPAGFTEVPEADKQVESSCVDEAPEIQQEPVVCEQEEGEEVEDAKKKARKKSLVSQIFGSDDEEHKWPDKAKKKKELMVDIFGSDDEGAAAGAKSGAEERSEMRITGLEGLETETISEGEEMNFDDLGDSEDNMEEGEIPIDKKKPEKRKSERVRKRDLDILINPQRRVIEVSPPNKRAEGGGGDYEEGEIVEDRPKHKKDKKEKSKKSDKDKKGHEGDENVDITGSSEVIRTSRKMKDASSKEILGSSENKDNRVQKNGRRNIIERLELGAPSVPWKKLSKTTKERNYRDSRAKGEDVYAKEKESKDKRDEMKEGKDKQDRKKREKRKELERYDVRKVVSERSKKEAEKKKTDEFGRDVSRSVSRDRSRSWSWSRSRDKGRRIRSSSRNRYYRRSRGRSRSRSISSSTWSSSWTPSWSRSYSRSRTRSRDRYRSRSRSRGRYRSRTRTPSRTRGRYRSASYSRDRRRRSRSRSRTRSRSRNRRVRSREKSRERSRERRRQRSREHSRERERHKRVKEPSPEKKKEKKEKKKEKKEPEKKKEIEKEPQKKKKKKDKSPILSKEVYASGDNIVVSVNFSKSKNKDHTQKDNKKKREISVEHNKEPQLKKSKKDEKREKAKEAHDKSPKTVVEKPLRVSEKVTRISEKPAHIYEKVARVQEKPPHVVTEKVVREPAPAVTTDTVEPQKVKEKKLISIPIKKEKALPKFTLKKPPVIIDLDLSPVRFYEPSPTDVIVLSDSDPDEQWKVKGGKTGKGSKVGKGKQGPIEKQKEVSRQVTVSTVTVQGPRTPLGPKTPPEPDNLAEPPIKFSIPMKKQLRAISNPLQEDEEESQSPVRRSPVRGPNTPPEPVPPEPDRQSDLEHDHGSGPRTPPSEKGPKTPPCEKGPKTPPLPGPTESDTYDPFDPTKSPTPSPPTPVTPASSPETEETRNDTDAIDGETESATVATASPIPPPEPQLPPLPEEPEPSEKPPEPDIPENGGQKTPPPAGQASPPPVQESKAAVAVTPKTTSSNVRAPPPTVPATSTPIAARAPFFPGLPANVASVLYSPVTKGLVPTAATSTTVFPQQAGITVHGTTHAASLKKTELSQLVSTQTSQKSAKPDLQPTQNGDSRQEDMTDVVDMDLDSPFSPGSSEGSELFEPPSEFPISPHFPPDGVTTPEAKWPTREKTRITKTAAKPQSHQKGAKSAAKAGKGHDIFDSLFGGSPGTKNKVKEKGSKSKNFSKAAINAKLRAASGKREIAIKMDEDQLKIMDELPSSAVELQFLKKLNRQERVVEEVKLALKPYYNRKQVNKEEYKEILRRSVPKICHNRSGEINPIKIRRLVEGYVKKFTYGRKKKDGKAPMLKLKPLTVKL